MRCFTREPLWQIRKWLQDASAERQPGDDLSFLALDPDIGVGLYPGELVQSHGETAVYRSHRTWMDLAETLNLRYLTPRQAAPPMVELRFQRLNVARTWHQAEVEDVREKYSPQSGYGRLNKLEEPWFLQDFVAALQRFTPPTCARILDLGINSGDEFAALSLAYGTDAVAAMTLTGLDHSSQAIRVARERFPGAQLYCHDINDIWSLELPPQDMIISIGTLQSPGIDDKNMVMQLRKRLLKPQGAMVLGFPNVRYVDGELRPGAAMKNFSEPELSLLVKDLFFYRRYLQKRGFRVVLTGKYYIFLTAYP